MAPALRTLQESVDVVSLKILGEHFPRKYREPKVIRDAVLGFHKIDPHFFVLIDSPFFQRLRRLHQTALALHTYPSATHTRFERSLGVFTIASRMLDAIEINHKFRGTAAHVIGKTDRLTVQTAALLHDISHGPFSHSSEDVYGRNPVFDQIRSEEPNTFADASASEIMGWCLLHSSGFKPIWEAFLVQCGRSVSLRNVTRMIVGDYEQLPTSMRALQSIVNGPVDADKLDYIARDGHFTGLVMPIDLERLLQGLLVDSVSNPEGEESVELVVDSAAIAALEQMVFARAQLYTQLYHHHKVRASTQLIQRLIVEIQKHGLGQDPANLLNFDDDSLLAYARTNLAKTLVNRLKLRGLPERCLVLSVSSFASEEEDPATQDRLGWGALRRELTKSASAVSKAENEIADGAKVVATDVMLDVPRSPKFLMLRQPLIRLWKRHVVSLSEVFPVPGWETAHETYLSVSYVMTTNIPARRAIASGARDWLARRDPSIKIKDDALRQAKL